MSLRSAGDPPSQGIGITGSEKRPPSIADQFAGIGRGGQTGMDRILDIPRQFGPPAHPGDYRPPFIGIHVTILQFLADPGRSMALGAGAGNRFPAGLLIHFTGLQ
jgi:hypothetical protein